MEDICEKAVPNYKLKNKELQNTLKQLKSNIKGLNFCNCSKY